MQNKRIQPHSGFIVAMAPSFSTFSAATLVNFYQPVIGPNAFALFSVLQAMMQAHPLLSKRISHTQLLNRLQLDSNQLMDARGRLEGVGLLKSFTETDQIGQVVVYELQPTLTPQAFNDDALLSILLLEAIGEQAYKQLMEEATKYQFDTTKLTATSLKLLDAFHINRTELKNPPAAIQTSRDLFMVNDEPQEYQVNSNFDFKLLMSLVAQQPVKVTDVEKYQELILSEHLMYGIDEVEMARLIGKAINLQTNQINPSKLKRVVAQQFPLIKESQTEELEQPQLANQPARHQSVKLSEQDRQLIQAATDYPPFDFLETLLQQKHGYLSPNQRQNLQNLIARHLFSNTVVNLLVYYLLVDMDSTTLTQALMDTVANSWSQAKVVSAEDAIFQMKNYHQQRQAKKAASRPKNQVVRETLPDWAKDDYQPKKGKTSQAEMDAIKARIDKLNASQEG